MMEKVPMQPRSKGVSRVLIPLRYFAAVQIENPTVMHQLEEINGNILRQIHVVIKSEHVVVFVPEHREEQHAIEATHVQVTESLRKFSVVLPRACTNAKYRHIPNTHTHTHTHTYTHTHKQSEVRHYRSWFANTS